MKSIYERVLGKAFEGLHPKMQQRFGIHSGVGVASVGQGVMEEIWYAKWAAAPLLLGSTRNIMFPQGGEGIPFTIANYAYEDSFGRETVTWSRRFRFPEGVRKFDATMIYSAERRCIVDYLGTKQHLAVDLDIQVSPLGGIAITSGEQRFYEGLLRFRLPKRLTGRANVHEWYDDASSRYRITVDIDNPLLGPVFRYRGWFQVSTFPLADCAVPSEVKPVREEQRE